MIQSARRGEGRVACMKNRTEGAACQASAETGVRADSAGVGHPPPSGNKIAVSAHFADNVRCKPLSWLTACVIA